MPGLSFLKKSKDCLHSWSESLFLYSKLDIHVQAPAKPNQKQIKTANYRTRRTIMTEATAEKKEMFYGEFGGQYVPAEIQAALD